MDLKAVGITTLTQLFRSRVEETPGALAYREYEDGEWQTYTWLSMASHVARWRGVLRRFGWSLGDRVAIMAPNGVQWVAFDQAALSLGLVTVPLFVNDSAGNVAAIVRRVGARILFTTAARRRAFLPDGEGLDDGAGQVTPIARIDDVLRDAVEDFAWERHTPKPDDVVSVVYTSGTSGMPKGVVLTHANLISNIRSALTAFDFREDDRYVSFLPLSHMFERTVGYYMMMWAGVTTTYARELTTVLQDIREFQPTVMIAVPRIYDLVVGQVNAMVMQRGWFVRWLFRAGLALTLWRLRRTQTRGTVTRRRMDWLLFDRLFGRRVRAQLGGCLRFAISGGAALLPRTAVVLNALGIPLRQGYGMTELSPVVSVCKLDEYLPSSVGRALPDVEVRVGDNDELLVRGPNVMRGYWRDDEATAATIDSGGWLHTGDKARMDAAGYLYITGRAKEIIVLDNGEKVSPVEIEQALENDLTVARAMVYGEGRAFLIALIMPDLEYLNEARRQELGLANEAGNLDGNRLAEMLRGRARRLCRAFPSYARIRRFVVTDEPWTIGNGSLTPTLKIRRAPIVARNEEKIAAAYGNPRKSGKRYNA